MVCDGLSRSCLINSVNSIRPLERQTLTRAQLLNLSEKFTGRATVSVAAIRENTKAENYATQTLAPSPAGMSATEV